MEHTRDIAIRCTIDTNKATYIGNFADPVEFLEWWNAYADIHGQPVSTDEPAACSPDREAGSGTADAGTCIVDGRSETLHCLTHGVSFERGGGDRIPETCRETTWRPPRASSHPVPSEGGGETQATTDPNINRRD